MKMDTTKWIIGAVLVAALVLFMLYWFGYLTAGVCDTVSKNKFECAAEESTIKSEEVSCKRACPTRAQWNKYCADKKSDCEDDCDLMLYEGKSQAAVNKCKKRCADQYQKDLASYKNKAQCEGECSKKAKKDLEALIRQYSE